MARTLGYDLAEFGALPADEEEEVRISSMCTVFAESEVVSLIARGVSRSRIAKSINQAVAARVAGMVKRFPVEEEIVFAGGCAHSPLLRGMLEKSLGKKLFVPSDREITGGSGAALCAVQESA
jgi:activator of 2-hydroxyglutaryl-CoA dehydratase